MFNPPNIHVPQSAIARYPTDKRSESKLMVVDLATNAIEHQHFTDLIDQLNPGDLLVMNNTKVIPSRLLGQKASGGQVECFVEQALNDHSALAYIRANRSPKAGAIMHFGPYTATLIEKKDAFWQVSFDAPLDQVLADVGHIPIPPYLKREDESLDSKRYQTVYAKNPGAVAAPTAGLHFDEALLKAIKAKGVNIAFVTLHVGSGTFKPLEPNAPLPATLHEERYELSAQTAALWQATREAGKRVIAVGTTSLRTLESAYDPTTQTLKPGKAKTTIFIKPGDVIHSIDGLVTNFHLPDSSLILLVGAIASMPTIERLYALALENHYRFYSYGDAMLLLTKPRG